jgi:hypothetical protein
MKTEESEQEWLCCFCGKAVQKTAVDPVHIEISFPDGDGNGFGAHRECLKKHLILHPSVTVDSFEEEMDLANNAIDGDEE